MKGIVALVSECYVGQIQEFGTCLEDKICSIRTRDYTVVSSQIPPQVLSSLINNMKCRIIFRSYNNAYYAVLSSHYRSVV